MTWRKARKARGARDTELAPLCSLNAGSKLCKRRFKVRRASHLCHAARGKACPGAKSCSSHWQGVPGCARNVPQYTPNSGGRSCPFPGHSGTAPKLLPEEMWESRSCSLTMLGGPAGTGGTPMAGHSMMVLPRKEGAGIPPGPQLQVNSSYIQRTLRVCCSHTEQEQTLSCKVPTVSLRLSCKDSTFAS